MTDKLLLVATLVFLLLTSFLLIALVRRWVGAAKYGSSIKWIEEQLDRAVGQVNSDDEDEILAGLQTLAMIVDPKIRIRCLDRIRALSVSENPIVAKHASATLDRIVDDLSGRSATPP
jgi:hypothetical protein